MRKLATIIAFSSCLFLTACSHKIKTDTSLIYTMDTVVTLTIYNCDDSKTHFNKIKEIYKEVENVSDDYKSGNGAISVYDLNNSREALVSDILLDLLKESVKVYEDTSGCFNPYIGRLSHKWKESIKENKILDDSIIKEELSIMKDTKIVFDENKVSIIGDGNIDLGAIAKGYATKKAKEYLESNNVKSYYIDAGKSSICLGDKDSLDLSVGLVKPYDKGYIGIIKGKNMAISCSSPENQHVVIDDNIYHHLLNPFNGYPSNIFDSVYVFNDNPLLGDAYSTAIFNMDLDTAISFSKEKNINILLYKGDSIIYKSEGVNIYE